MGRIKEKRYLGIIKIPFYDDKLVLNRFLPELQNIYWDLERVKLVIKLFLNVETHNKKRRHFKLKVKQQIFKTLKPITYQYYDTSYIWEYFKLFDIIYNELFEEGLVLIESELHYLRCLFHSDFSCWSYLDLRDLQWGIE
jgi:hypothetical protein